MAERTVSIVIEVDGAKDAASEVRRMRSALDDLGSGAEGLARIVKQSRELTQAMKDVGNAFDLRQRQREMAGGLDDFFRRVTAGARSAGDIFKNIWREAGEYFERVLRQMTSAASFSFGGFLPAGGLGGGSSSGGLLGSLGLGIFGLSMGLGSPVSRGIGSVAGGALAGLGFGGPIGAVVGGLIGGIASLFGKDKKKEHDAGIANQGFAQLRQILDDYMHFRRDFASSVDAANRIWAQMASQWVRPQSAPSQRVYFDAILRSLQDTESERLRRRQMQALLPVPEFESGGFVGARSSRSRGGSGVLAMLHPGEFVMNRQAVDRWGVSVLEGLNRGSAPAGGGGLSVSIDPDGARWLEQNADALERGIAVVLRRGGPVSRALRA
jgi:hypothetical protein